MRFHRLFTGLLGLCGAFRWLQETSWGLETTSGGLRGLQQEFSRACDFRGLHRTSGTWTGFNGLQECASGVPADVQADSALSLLSPSLPSLLDPQPQPPQPQTPEPQPSASASQLSISFPSSASSAPASSTSARSQNRAQNRIQNRNEVGAGIGPRFRAKAGPQLE